MYYHMLSYKIITRIVLYRIGIENSPFCSRCKECRETIEHKFWHCKEVNDFWKSIVDLVNDLNVFQGMVSLTCDKVILGSSVSIVENRVIDVGKGMIARKVKLSVNLFINKLKIELSNERCIAQRNGLLERFKEIWGPLETTLARGQ